MVHGSVGAFQETFGTGSMRDSWVVFGGRRWRVERAAGAPLRAVVFGRGIAEPPEGAVLAVVQAARR